MIAHNSHDVVDHQLGNCAVCHGESALLGGAQFLSLQVLQPGGAVFLGVNAERIFLAAAGLEVAGHNAQASGNFATQLVALFGSLLDFPQLRFELAGLFGQGVDVGVCTIHKAANFGQAGFDLFFTVHVIPPT